MATYSFVSAWKIGAPPEDVWEFIGDPLRWKLFWPGLEDARLIDGDLGVYEFVFRSFLPFSLNFRGRMMSKEPPRRMVIETLGQLEGTGVIDLEPRPDRSTFARMTWDTRSTLLWMNLSAPLMRGLFEWNHDLLMERARDGLARRLGAPVVTTDSGEASLVRALLPFATLVGFVWGVARLRRWTRS